MKPTASVELQPSHLLGRLYSPQRVPYAFKAKDAAAAKRWQSATRARLARLLSVPGLKRVGMTPRILDRVDMGEYEREKVLIRTSPYSVMPVHLLLPKRTPRPMPVVLALAGHGRGVTSIIGLNADGSPRELKAGEKPDFGVALCRRGFAVAAPEISCFGERQSDFSHLKTGQEPPRSCAHTAYFAAHLGTSAMAIRVHDAMRLVDYLQTRRDIDASRLGAMGISGGGAHTFFSAAVDTRIKAAVVSAYFCTFRHSIFAMHHCPCNFIPGLHPFGEMHDIVGLIAPRPLLIESGSNDPIFPREGVEIAAARTRKVYRAFGAAKHFETDFFEGAHEISGARAYDFLWEHLAD